MLAAWQKWAFISAYYFVLVVLRVVFLVAGPKQSNQIAFLCECDASQCSHSAHTMGKFILLRQQGCQCNLWVCWSECRLRAVQLGMLMGFGQGTELSACFLTSSSFLRLTTWTKPIWSLRKELPYILKMLHVRLVWTIVRTSAVLYHCYFPRNHLLN